MLPNAVAPSLKVTVPAGVPPVDETVAVKVTVWPKVEGFALEVTAVVVAAGLTVCCKFDEVLVAKFVSPAYTALMVCAATVRLEVVKLA